MTIRSAFVRKTKTVPSSLFCINSMFQGIQVFLSSHNPLFGILSCPLSSYWFLWALVAFVLANTEGTVSPSFSFLLSIHFLRKKRSRDLKLQDHYLGQSRRATHSLTYLHPWPSIFLCLLYRGKTFLHMEYPEPLLYFLNGVTTLT